MEEAREILMGNSDRARQQLQAGMEGDPHSGPVERTGRRRVEMRVERRVERRVEPRVVFRVEV